jgi:DNA polymerase-3 subunit gamma/tau
MSHQVLARKWRPRSFETLVGQEHVVKAISHALQTERLHHAYLFTGTRGVGKTTIARILAKAVNCEQGMSATPCGECSACTQIDQGGFVDYLELDAASNRGVDEMVQILDNAVYAPTAGRYKVYVIDEVHMLSAHAFNAMLKTLEEPPPHMLFILATTDPQKVPVTVLSRCMQFNLRNMHPAAIADHLSGVLEQEAVNFEAPALALIGRAAAGSMRDALSLTDQAIAAGAGEITEQQVRDMLGMIDSGYVDRVLAALAAGDGPALVAIADEVTESNDAADRLLADTASALSELATAQATGAQPAHNVSFDAASLQVYYQIAIHGQRDLPLAPDARTGLMMSLLRMLAFSDVRPASVPDTPSGSAPAPASSKPAGGAAEARAALAAGRGKSAPGKAADKPAAKPAPAKKSAVATQRTEVKAPQPQPQPQPQPNNDMPPEPPPLMHAPDEQSVAVNEKQPEPVSSPEPARVAAPAPEVQKPNALTPNFDAASRFDGDWPALARRMALTGRLGQFMTQSQLEGFEGDVIRLRVPIEQLADKKLVARVSDAIEKQIGQIRLEVSVGRIDGETAAAEVESERLDRLDQARASLEADPFVKTMRNEFDATIVPDSVRAVSETKQ